MTLRFPKIVWTSPLSITRLSKSHWFTVYREISFELDLENHGEDLPDNFYEGVEVSVGNWNNNSHWIPLRYFAKRESIHSSENINFGLLNSTENTVNIRGYTVPYRFQNFGDESLSVNLSVCGESLLRDDLQIRWLQTVKILPTKATLLGNLDVLTLKNVVIAHKMGGNCSRINSLPPFTHKWGELRNCGVVTSPACGNMSSDCLLFGANCTTVNCNCDSINAFVAFSRIATTLPLNTGYTCPSDEVTSTSSSIQTSPTSNVTSLSTSR